MCGIAGGFSFGAGLPVENRIVTRLMNFSVTVDQMGRRGYGLPTTNGLSSGIAA
jgi:hypothetical protein